VALAYIILMVLTVLTTLTTSLSYNLRDACSSNSASSESCISTQRYLALSWRGRQYNNIEIVMKLLYYTTLWTVKLSFLLLLRRHLTKMPGHMKWWWMIVTLWAGGLFGCYLSSFMVCPSRSTFTTQGNDSFIN